MTPNQKPLLTICIAAHNRLQYLPQAISSAICQQTEVPYEILIIDDCSNDGTAEYLRTLNDPRIRVFSRQTNGGESAARNDAVAQSSSEWLLWLDDDDCLLPHAVNAQMNCLQRHPQAEIIYANLQICDEQLKPRPEYLRYCQIEPNLLLYRLLIDNMLANGGTMIRRTVFDRVGSYDLAIKRSMDYDFWARAALKKCCFVHNDDFIYLYRAHAGNYINPREQDPEHHLQYGRVAAKILQSAALEEIFPMFDWQQKPQQAAAQSLAVAALVFLKWEQFEPAHDVLNQSESFMQSREATAIRGMIYRRERDFERAADCLSKAVLSFGQGSLLELFKLSCLNVAEDYKKLLQ